MNYKDSRHAIGSHCCGQRWASLATRTRYEHTQFTSCAPIGLQLSFFFSGAKIGFGLTSLAASFSGEISVSGALHAELPSANVRYHAVLSEPADRPNNQQVCCGRNTEMSCHLCIEPSVVIRTGGPNIDMLSVQPEGTYNFAALPGSSVTSPNFVVRQLRRGPIPRRPRPSHNCIRQLNTRTRPLQALGVTRRPTLLLPSSSHLNFSASKGGHAVQSPSGVLLRVTVRSPTYSSHFDKPSSGTTFLTPSLESTRIGVGTGNRTEQSSCHKP